MSGWDERSNQAIHELVARDSSEAERQALADAIAAEWEQVGDRVLGALENPEVRRWARGYLMERLSENEARALAGKLLEWRADLQQGRRDRSTSSLMRFLSVESINANLNWLAGSNAAGAVWERLAQEGTGTVYSAARQILRNADIAARETTLHLLVLDPYGPQYLEREKQDELLRLALDDEESEIRGLAAEVVAADLPDLLFERWDAAPLDQGERVRMAFWRAALVHQSERAADDAAGLILDENKPLEPRRSALLALGEHLPTRKVAPVLQTLLMGGDEILAEDAAQLMWRHHRTPEVANAAAESQFEAVRVLAERLLHPERGSPAAGGSRPGDPTKTTEIFDQIANSGEWRDPSQENE